MVTWERVSVRTGVQGRELIQDGGFEKEAVDGWVLQDKQGLGRAGRKEKNPGAEQR